ncbi:MAG: hypothetical protein C4339_05940 [Nitrososphaerota archaeon]
MRWPSLRRPELSARGLAQLLALALLLFAAITLRALPAKHGYYLNEFDPYYDYKAANYIVNAVESQGLLGGLFGPSGYFNWVDKTTWYPEGRAVAVTSQDGLHLTGAFTYLFIKDVLGLNVSLYDYLVIFPVLFGAFTIFPLFLLARRLGGAQAGLAAALLFSVTPPVIQRGNLGWFKSEPLALFLSTLGLLLFAKAYSSEERRWALYSALAGLVLGYSLTSWGGSQFFLGVMALFCLLAIFAKEDAEQVKRAALLTSTLMVLTGALFPRPGPLLALNAGGLALYASLGLLLAVRRERALPSLATLVSGGLVATLAALALFSFDIPSGLSLRYLSVVAPLQRGQNALVESVAEHLTPSGADYLYNFGPFLLLALLGAVVALRRRSNDDMLALSIGIFGIYSSSSFSRLLVFAALAAALLGGLGLSSLMKALAAAGAKLRQASSAYRLLAGLLLALLLAFFFVNPFYSRGGVSGWVVDADVPTSIASAAVPIRAAQPIEDWLQALAWIRQNTPTDAIIASWWDYGYWINVMGNRTVLVDNATLNSTKIAEVGRAFMSDEATGIHILRDELKANYVVVMVAVSGIGFYPGVYSFERDPYGLTSLGGDGSKMQWFARIPGLNVSLYLDSNLLPTPYFWSNTLLGKLFPFKPDYALTQQYQQQVNQGLGFTPPVLLVREQVHYPSGGSGPLQLVFQSSAQPHTSLNIRVFVLVYRIA